MLSESKFLVIQVCCYNEAPVLPSLLRSLPRSVPGFSKVEWVLVDDGSQDATIEIARSFGVDHIVPLKFRRGLATAFQAGIETSIALGADVIVHTDADNQYSPKDIPKLTEPVLKRGYHLSIGKRPIWKVAHWRFHKKCLQVLGSKIVSFVAGTRVEDVTCGFRCYSVDAAKLLRIYTDYTYTLESIISLSHKRIPIANVDISAPPIPNRESRLMKHLPQYLIQAGESIICSAITYRPFQVIFIPGAIALVLSFLLGGRYLYYKAIGEGARHIHSVVLCGTLLSIGLAFFLTGFIVTQLSNIRRQVERSEADPIFEPPTKEAYPTVRKWVDSENIVNSPT